MGKHRGTPADEPGKDLVWDSNASADRKAANFDAYDQHLKDNAKPDNSNPYSKENFNSQPDRRSK
jgi:hypothetical protein